MHTEPSSSSSEQSRYGFGSTIRKRKEKSFDSKRNMILEICANSIQSALNAQTGQADRIELCQNLEQGGITPSYGLIKQCKQKLSIPVFVLIRPRPGDFVYDDEEIEIMKTDLQVCRSLGCEGVVFGILNSDRTVDKTRCRELLEVARPMQVTFHRAFDECQDQIAALKALIDLGFDRVLTSGDAGTALKGSERLASLVEQADGRIIVVPGGGINADNLREVMSIVPTTEFHGSAKQALLAEGVEPRRVDTNITSSQNTNSDHVRLLRKILDESSNLASSLSSSSVQDRP